MWRVNLAGHRVGRLAVEGLDRIETRGHADRQRRVYMWKCRCDCGATVVVDGQSLRGTKTRSCGCLHREIVGKMGREARVHGEAVPGHNSVEYRAWVEMLRRCRRRKAYVAMGVRVADRWHGRGGYQAFLSHIGRRPSDAHSVDRIDTTGHYEPGNVRWATPTQQTRNRRCTVLITIGGITKTAAEWAEESGLRRQTVWRRYRSGWPEAELLSAPAPLVKRIPYCRRKESK